MDNTNIVMSGSLAGNIHNLLEIFLSPSVPHSRPYAQSHSAVKSNISKPPMSTIIASK